MKLRFLPVLLLPLMSLSARADVKPMALFGDHMVLQRDKPIQVFGTADANEPIRVSIGLKAAATVADAAGKWRVMLSPMQSGLLTYDLTITGRDAAKAVVLHDVAIGEVWLCSGQSNMEFPLSRAQNAEAEIAAADDPQLRLFAVARPQSADTDTPRSDVKGHWVATTPTSAHNYSYSAAAYFFGRELRQKLGVPIGLIHSSVGGTAAESWTSRTTLDSTPQLAAIGEKFRAHFQRLQAVNVKYKGSLAEWQLKADAAKAANQPEPEGKPVKPGHENADASTLYNGMIAPLAPFGIRGVIWYQGESNAGRAAEYRTLFPAMITDWRQTFAQGDFPFIYVQLANNGTRQDPTQPPSDSSGWASLREAQRLTLSVPNTGMAVILDTSSTGNLHPPEKQPVGHRLAAWALKSVYNQDVPQSGPLFQSATLEGNQIRLKFSHTDNGLLVAHIPLVKDSPQIIRPIDRPGELGYQIIDPYKPLQGFVIAGADKKFVWADAKIDGDSVLVSSAQVAQPVWVRYAWANNPIGNLYNGAGLPASSFEAQVAGGAGK